MIPLETMAIPLEGENPAGANLEYDPLYMEMDSLSVTVPDSQMGESIIEGRGPDWRKLKENCLNLWGSTRDLRVASYLTVAETAENGLEDCLASFKLILFLAKDMWDTMHPQLDPDDGNDPTERLNILVMLSPEPGAFNDPVMFISRFRALNLVPSMPYTLRDHLISINEFEAADGQTLDPHLITGELMRVPLEEVEKQAKLAVELRETVEAICITMDEKMQGSHSLNMNSLLAEINKLCKFYANYIQSAGGSSSELAQEDTGAEDTPAQPAEATVRGANINLSAYKPASRAEAVLLLRKGAEYFQRQEPNSPIPLLVNRALRFSEMNFIDLLQDIVPDALDQGKRILGVKESES